MSGVMQMIMGTVIVQQLPPRFIADTGILETGNNPSSSFFTTNKGVSWSSITKTGDSYGGMSSGNIFLFVSSGEHRNYNDTLSSNINIGSGSVVRYHVNPRTNVIMRQVSDNIERSTNGGVSWTTVHTRSPGGSFSNGFHYGNGVWFHSWTDTNVGPRVVYDIRSTDDGLTWSSSGITGIPDSNSFSGHTFFGNGYHYYWHPNNYVYRSTDALTWSLISTTRWGSTSPYGQQNLPFFLDGYFYVTNNGQIRRTADMITWTTFGNTVPFYSGVSYLAYMNGNWVISGSEYSDTFGEIYNLYSSSNDASTWTQRNQWVGSGPKGLYGLNQHYAV